MKSAYQKIAFLQASGIVLYVSAFVFLINAVQGWMPMRNPIVGPIVLLLAFVISALVCGLLMFGYPCILFFGGNVAESIRIVLASVVWLLAFFAIFVALLFLGH